MTSRFSQQQRGLLSEIRAQALEAQRHALINDATAEMMRRDTLKKSSVPVEK